jgi:hypothetical protein
LKFIVTYATEFGSISIESKRSDDVINGLDELRRIAKKLESKKQRRIDLKVHNTPQSKAKGKRRGHGETAVILAEIESKLLTTDYFSKARSTGETGTKLTELTGKRFTSRKVSQALGILRQNGRLHRQGKRNYFKYSI